MPSHTDGFGTIVKNLGGGGVQGVSTSTGIAGTGAVGKVVRVVQDEVLLDNPSCVVADGNGNLWVGNSDNDTTSLVKLSEDTFEPTVIQLDPSNPFGELGQTLQVSWLAYASSHVFAATYHGAVYVLNTTTNAVVGSLIGPNGGDAGELFQAVCVDDNGDVWAMSSSSPSEIYKWTAPFTVAGKAPAQVWSTGHNMTGLIFSNGYLWSGSGGGSDQLHRINRANGATASYSTQMTYAWKPNAGGGLIWIASNTHVQGYNPATFPGAPDVNVAFGGSPVNAREVLWDGSTVWVFCDDRGRSVMRVNNVNVVSTMTYPLMSNPQSPILLDSKIWFCNFDDDVSFEGALVRIDTTNESFDFRYQGTTKLAYVDDTGTGNWYRATGGLQQAPFLNAGGRIILQEDSQYGVAITNAGGDRIRLTGGYDVARQFRLSGNVGSVVNGTVSYQWYNVTTDEPIGRLAGNEAMVTVRDAVAYLTVAAGKSVLVELRLMYVDSLTQIGSSGASGDFLPTMFIEVIGSGPLEERD